METIVLFSSFTLIQLTHHQSVITLAYAMPYAIGRRRLSLHIVEQ